MGRPTWLVCKSEADLHAHSSTSALAQLCALRVHERLCWHTDALVESFQANELQVCGCCLLLMHIVMTGHGACSALGTHQVCDIRSYAWGDGSFPGVPMVPEGTLGCYPPGRQPHPVAGSAGVPWAHLMGSEREPV